MGPSRDLESLLSRMSTKTGEINMYNQHLANRADDRRGFLGLALLGGATAGFIAESSLEAGEVDDGKTSARLQGLFPEGAPAAAPGYSPGIRAEGKRVIFVSGQGPRDLQADMETQIRQVFERIGLVLKSGDASFRDVVLIRAYFVRLSRDLPIYRKVRKDYLGKPYPASTTVGVTELAIPGLEVEIEAIAIA
jgi:enamine deaminase RidA (YjgF/YER057c/UK114 family)